MKRKGWIIWTWGKMGSLMVFTGMMIMMLTAYAFVGNTSQSNAANQLSADLRNSILDTYNSVGGMSFEFNLPKSLNGQDYSIEILDKKGNTVAILIRTKSGSREVLGGASFAAPLSDMSFGMLKEFDQELHYICIVKYQNEIYLEKSECS